MLANVEDILAKADYPGRPEVSVYWTPGCSMCLNTKEFLEKKGIPYESVNCLEENFGLEELAAVGLRGLPVVRRGRRFSYVQSLDAVAQFLEVSRGDRRLLTQEELIQRWDTILGLARLVIFDFSEEILQRWATMAKPRTVMVLSAHIFQIPEVFVRIIDEGIVETLDLQDTSRANIVTRDDLVAFIDKTIETFQNWRARGGPNAIPETLLTYYGEQPAYLVLERAVWHSAQHARQLDAVAAGLGGEYKIPAELYQDLPMPQRLWA